MDGVVWHIALCHMGLGPDDASPTQTPADCLRAELLRRVEEALPALRGKQHEPRLRTLARAEGVRP